MSHKELVKKRTDEQLPQSEEIILGHNREARRKIGRILKNIDGLTASDTLQSLYDVRIETGKPKVISLVSANQKHSWMYIRVSKNSLKKKIAKLGWAGTSWEATEEGYKRDADEPDNVKYFVAVIRVAYSQSDQDKPIHTILENTLNIRRTREFYDNNDLANEYFIGATFEKFMTAVCAFYNLINFKRIRTLDDKFYGYQNDKGKAVANKVFIDSCGQVFLVAPTRSGKSYMVAISIKNLDEMLKSANKEGIKTILIVTPYPDGWKSYNKAFNEHIDLYGYKAINVRIDKQLPDITNENEKLVIFVSWAKMKTGNSNKFLEWIEKFKIDILVIEEYHREADSFLSVRLIMNAIKPRFIVSVSATPYNEFMIGVANKFNTVSLTDEQLHTFRRLHKLPDYMQSLYCKEFLELARKYITEDPECDFTLDEGFTWDKLFTIINDCGHSVFKYETAIKKLLRDILDADDPREKSLAFKYAHHGRFNHILAFAPSVAAAILLARMVDGLWGYKAIYWTSVSKGKSRLLDKTGKKLMSGKTTEDKINKFHTYWESEGWKTIIFTANSLAAAVTLEKLTAILIIKHISSAELFDQIMGRPNNTDPDNPIRHTAIICPKGVLLTIAAKQLLYAIAMYPNVEPREILRKILKNMNIFSDERGEWGEQLIDDLLNDILSSTTMRQHIGLDDPSFSMRKFDDYALMRLKELLINVNAKLILPKSSRVEVGDGGKDGKNARLKYIGNIDRSNLIQETDDDLKIKNKIRNVFGRMQILISIKKPNNVAELMALDESVFLIYLKASKEYLQILFDGNYISSNVWNAKLKLVGRL